MGILAWLLIGSGVYLEWAAITNRNPLTSLTALMKGKPVPAKGSWHPVPDSPKQVVGQWMPIPGRAEDLGQEGASAGTSSTTDKRQKVVAFAAAQIGDRYVFGAAGPNTWDCSGLTMMAYKEVGVTLPHNAAMQQLRGKKVSSPSVGDLVFWGAVSGHCGVFVGNGQIIHAPQPGDVVKQQAIWDLAHVNYRSYL